MSTAYRASRDVIIRTNNLDETTRFYETVLHFPVLNRSETLVCFDAGAFQLYVEAGPRHGPVFDFLVPDLHTAKQELVQAGCVIIEDNPAVPRCYIGDPHGMLFNIAQA